MGNGRSRLLVTLDECEPHFSKANGLQNLPRKQEAQWRLPECRKAEQSREHW
jgi:hypothetical protein